uniref:Uncharacterized protein n=1 Tax=Nicotiana tabacum TaxID=4097 RepID=A0A1S3Z7N2_TOBAC|nr:PREDICTED: uncharacterized protein LOC107783962 [Nicotiana tabacum]
MTSNIAESINTANKDASELPVMRLLEYMTNLLQQWNNKNRKSAMETSTELGEKMYNSVRPATKQLYTVFEGAWTVLKNQQLKPGQYCFLYYKKDKLLRIYEFPVNPMLE